VQSAVQLCRWGQEDLSKQHSKLAALCSVTCSRQQRMQQQQRPQMLLKLGCYCRLACELQ
jgi:hypothetical protein